MADSLYSMLSDRDPLVVANCVAALEEVCMWKTNYTSSQEQILAVEGGIVLSKEIAHTLFNRLKEFPDWSQCVIMGVLVRYVPSNQDEVFDILVR